MTQEQDRDDANFELAMGMPIGCLRPGDTRRTPEEIEAKLKKYGIKLREPWYVRWMKRGANGS